MESNLEMIDRMQHDDFEISVRNYASKYGTTPLWSLLQALQEEEQEKARIGAIKFNNSLVMCPCVKSLFNRTDLKHRERLVLLNNLMWFGNDGEEKLWSILKKQKNYKESMSKYQINSWKKKGGCKPIRKATLKEWGICKC